MTWSAFVPGQPISVNHAYAYVWRYDKRRRLFRARALTQAAQRYVDDAALIMRAAKPARWQPEGQIRIVLDLRLGRDMDGDNVLKLLLDAFQAATGVNDRWVLPCIRSKTTGVAPLQQGILLEVSPLSSPDPVS